MSDYRKGGPNDTRLFDARGNVLGADLVSLQLPHTVTSLAASRKPADGGCEIRVAGERGLVVVDFRRNGELEPSHFIKLTPDQADAFADAIREKAALLR